VPLGSLGPRRDEDLALAATKVALQLGANVNAVNDQGNTALHGAAPKGFDSVIQLLGENGARPDVKNKRGQTPLAMIEGRKDGEVAVTSQPTSLKTTAALLRKFGAKN
jgi:ankyrin repeat protein